MLIEADTISALPDNPNYTTSRNLNKGTSILLSLANRKRKTNFVHNNNSCCDPFNLNYCSKHHKHQVLQVTNPSTNNKGKSHVALGSSTGKISRKAIRTKYSNSKQPTLLNTVSAVRSKNTKNSISSRSFPVSDSSDGNSNSRKNNTKRAIHVKREDNVNNTKTKYYNFSSVVKRNANVNKNRPTGNLNDVRSDDNSKQSSKGNLHDVIANTFGKCSSVKTEALTETVAPSLIINNSQSELQSSVKRRLSICQHSQQRQLLYYNPKSDDNNLSASTNITTSSLGNVNSFNQDFYSFQSKELDYSHRNLSNSNSFSLTENIGSQSQRIHRKANNSFIYSNKNIFSSTNANTNNAPVKNNKLHSLNTSTNRLTSASTNTDFDIFSSDSANSTNNIFTRVSPSTFSSSDANTNPRVYANAKRLSNDRNEITVKSYIDATRDYINTLVYLVKTEVLSMGKIQDLKDKVGANQITMPQKDIWRCLMAEFVGTALLCLIGCGSGLYMTLEDKTPLVGGALCWGLIVASLAQSLGAVSGCHINPAITLALFVTGKIQLVKAGLYMIVQCLGATVGICVLKAITPEKILGDFNPTALHNDITPLQGFGIEVLLTFVLGMIVFGVGDENRTDILGSKPLAVGLTVASLVLFGGPLTGASMNPARSLGPSIVSGRWENHWIYWLGPMCGAVIAGLLYQNIFRAMRADEVEAFEIEKQTRSRQQEAKENGASPPV